jgi:hypothetical protein
MKIKLTIILLLIFYTAGYACRYTVREIGFADFGKDSYQLVLFNDGRISLTDVKTFKSISRAALLDANIDVMIIDIENDTSSVLKYYKKGTDGLLPNVILVSPEKRAKAFFFDESADFMETVWDLLEKLVMSPARKKLTDNIIKSYGVIYFIEGTDKHKNTEARKIMNAAVDEIKLIMLSLPKPVNTPPQIVTIKANETNAEEVLLWSLGWKKTDAKEPAIALMYGRGRRMGPMLKGGNIKENVIRNMLRFIGEDCECGLDRSWMLGTMVPMRWDSKLKAAVLKQYGFDADNPLIISEMSQILSIAPNRVNHSVNTDLLYGYAENVLIISDTNKKAETKQFAVNKPNKTCKAIDTTALTTNTNIIPVDTLIIEKKEKSKPEITKTEEPEFGIKEALGYSLLGLLLIVIIGGIIFFKTKKDNG